MKKLLQIFLLFPLFALTACSDASDVSSSQLREASAVGTQYYLGKTTVKSDQGDEATEDVLITRETFQQEKTVKVTIYIWSEIEYLEKHILNMTATSGNQFAVEGSYFQEKVVGHGEVVGNIYGEWSQWTFQGSLPSDQDVNIISSSQLSSNGKMVNEASIYFKDDPLPIITINEVLYKKDPSDPEFAELLKEVLSH